MTTVICAPRQLDLDSSIQFAKSLKKIVPSHYCVFDFGQVSKFRPFGMMRTAYSIRDIVLQYRDQTRFEWIYNPNAEWNQRAVGYAEYMRFFQACGFDGSNAAIVDEGNSYLPITYAKISELVAGHGHQGSRIESIAAQLAHHFLHESSSPVFTAVAYSFSEMIRNVVEHSKSETIGYCAQFWQSRDLVEIAIVDNGIGVRQSLENNPHLTTVTDSDALKFALMPGVSGKMFGGVPNQFGNDFQNSGYGLYMNYRLCNEGGDFFISSGQSGLYRTKDADKNEYYETAFPGTILRLRLSTTNLQNYEKLLDEFRKEGRQLAKQSKNGANLTASRASALLRDNFRSLRSGIVVGARVQHTLYGVGQIVDIIASKPEDLALVSFDGGRSKRVQLSTLIKYDGPPPQTFPNDDIPF